MKIFYIPIEPYETRYTADWVFQFETEFSAAGVNYETVLGETNSTKVTDGGVLDACGTHLYKFTQLNKLISKINSHEVKDGDILFFADLWFPGIESLFYIRQMLKINFKIMGIFHAGTYDFHDFTYRNGMRSWGKWVEACWFSGIDKIFVATEFHKNLLLKNSATVPQLSNKIYVTGLPFYGKQLHDRYITEKENILVFPHRVDEEKHPELFDKLVLWLESAGVVFTPIKTIVETKSREEYFKLLGRSKVMVSFAEQETFGYSTLESMALDNIVVVPDALSYRETVPNSYRYSNFAQACELVKNALLNYTNPNYSTEKWENSIPNMLKLMSGD